VEKTQNTLEDCLTRVPLIIKPPRGVKAEPGVSSALVELVDFSATVYDLTGIEPGYTSFGQSLLPVLAGENAEHRDAVFSEGGRLIGEVQAMERESLSMMDEPEKGHYWPRIKLQVTDEKLYHGKASMCRTKSHKYIRRLYETDEFYDLQNDPGELHNVIDDPAYAQIIAQLKDRMTTWYMETCDVVPLDTDRRW